MSARSPTEVYLCVNRPVTRTPPYKYYQRGLIKFTNLVLNSEIQWFLTYGIENDRS